MAEVGEWTWLVYMAGDNNLEGAGQADLEEMQRVGSSDAVKVLVQFDTEEKHTTRYLVEKGSLKTLQSMPGVDCGDPKVLREFVTWGATEYPAKHYVVDVWNHGGGWENLPPGYDYEALRSAKPITAAKVRRLRRSVFRTTVDKISQKPPGQRAIAIDVGSHDYLDNQELHDALASVLPDVPKIDVLGCDACLMNMLEIAYEMQDTASFMVGSEEIEPGSGWPYEEILGRLIADPAMSPEDLAKEIASLYGTWYRDNGDPNTDASATQSALDLGAVQSVADAVDALATAMIADLAASANGIAMARDRALSFEMPEYVDLVDFCEQLKKRVTNTAIVKAAQDVQAAVTRGFVIANATWGAPVEKAGGVSIYFPQYRPYGDDAARLAEEYAGLRYSKQGKWADFLTAFLNA